MANSECRRGSGASGQSGPGQNLQVSVEQGEGPSGSGAGWGQAQGAWLTSRCGLPGMQPQSPEQKGTDLGCRKLIEVARGNGGGQRREKTR